MTELPVATVAAADFYDKHYAGAEVLQVFLPSLSQDKCIDGVPLTLTPFPTPGAPDPVRHGRPSVKVENLTGREPVKGEKVPAVFGLSPPHRGRPTRLRMEPDLCTGE
jgi:hypothetical protein